MRIAIVTGASSGMGREMVYRLSDRFAGLEEIWVIARRAERLEEFTGRVPLKIRKFALDLTRPEDLKKLEGELREQKPEVRILVNAAGCGKTGKIGEIPREEALGMIRINDEALVAVTETVPPYIPDHSRIIQFASAAAFLPQPGFAVYAASKAFVLSYSRALNGELRGRGIAVTAVCPGPVETEFLDTALGGGSLPAYKRLVMAKPAKVVKCAIRDSAAGKEISIAGLPMKLFFIACKILPHAFLMRFIN